MSWFLCAVLLIAVMYLGEALTTYIEYKCKNKEDNKK